MCILQVHAGFKSPRAANDGAIIKGLENKYKEVLGPYMLADEKYTLLLNFEQKTIAALLLTSNGTLSESRSMLLELMPFSCLKRHMPRKA